MARHPRGTGFLLLVAAVIAAAAGGVVYWATRPPPSPPSFQIFHWIPGPEPLRIVGYPSTGAPQGGDLSGQLNPRLLGVIRDAVFTGELRLVCELPSTALPKPQSVALLLVNPPGKSHTLPLFDTRAAVYVETGTGYSFHPGIVPPLNESITITPSEPKGWFHYQVLFGKGGAGSSGPVQLLWW